MSVIIDGTNGVTTPALDSDGNLEYSGTLTGSTGVVNIGSGQVYKDASGNVGIGTSTPGGALDVAGGYARFQSSGGFVSFGDNGYIRTDSAGFLQFQGGSTATRFMNSSNSAEFARINSSGNLLVGTTSANPAQGFAFSPFSNAYQLIGHASGVASGNWYMGFSYNSGNIGSIAQNGTTGVSYNTSSDYRLKENIAPMQNALATVAQLKPCTYNWKVDGSTGQGFIAHELQAVVPDCVTGEKDAVDEDGKPQYQGVDTSFLVATLVAAIQEQQTLIQSLTTRIEALEAV